MMIQKRWSKAGSNSDKAQQEVVQAIAVDKSGNLYAAGYRTAATNRKYAWIGHYDVDSGKFTELDDLKRETNDAQVSVSAIALGNNNRLYVAGTTKVVFGSTSIDKGAIFETDKGEPLDPKSDNLLSNKGALNHVWVAEYVVTQQSNGQWKAAQKWVVVLNHHGDQDVHSIVTDGSSVYLTGSTNTNFSTSVPSPYPTPSSPTTAWVAKVTGGQHTTNWIDQVYPIESDKTSKNSRGLNVLINGSGNLEVIGVRDNTPHPTAYSIWVAEYNLNKYNSSTREGKSLTSPSNMSLSKAVHEDVTDITTDGQHIYVAGHTVDSPVGFSSAFSPFKVGGKWHFVAGFDISTGRELWPLENNLILKNSGGAIQKTAIAVHGQNLYVTGDNVSAAAAWVANIDAFTGEHYGITDISLLKQPNHDQDAYAIAANDFGIYIAGSTAQKSNGVVARLVTHLNVILEYIRKASRPSSVSSGVRPPLETELGIPTSPVRTILKHIGYPIA